MTTRTKGLILFAPAAVVTLVALGWAVVDRVLKPLGRKAQPF